MHPPGLDTVVVVDAVCPPDRAERVLRGLDIARLIHRAGLQQQFRTVPVDVQAEPGQRLGLRLARQFRFLPVLAAVKRDVHARDLAVAGPGQAGDDQRPLPVIDRCLWRGRGDDGFRVHHPGPFPRPPVGHQVGVFRRFLAAFDGLIVNPDPAQPLHPHIAFEPRHDEADGVAVFFPKRLAIGVEGDKDVVHRLFQRHGAAVGGRIGALGIDPFAFGLHARLFQQQPQRHADIFHVVDHALGELAALKLRAAPFHAAVRRAFAEGGAGFAGKAGEVFVGEDQRCFDKPVDHQAIVGFRQLDRAGMVAFKGAALRGYRAFKRVDRREVDRGDGAFGQPFDIAAHDLRFKADRHAVGCRIDRIAEGGRPVLHLGDQRVGCAFGPRRTGHGKARACGQPAAQDGASAGPLVLGSAHRTLLLRAVVHLRPPPPAPRCWDRPSRCPVS